MEPQRQCGTSFSEGTCSDDSHRGEPPLQYLRTWNTITCHATCVWKSSLILVPLKSACTWCGSVWIRCLNFWNTLVSWVSCMAMSSSSDSKAVEKKPLHICDQPFLHWLGYTLVMYPPSCNSWFKMGKTNEETTCRVWSYSQLRWSSQHPSEHPLLSLGPLPLAALQARWRVQTRGTGMVMAQHWTAL